MAHDASVKSEQEFNRDNNSLIQQRDQAQLAFDEAMATKTSFESQIEVLGELLYTVTNEAIIEEIGNKVTEFEGEIVAAEAIIEAA